MQVIEKALEGIGLSPKEQAVFKALYALGSATLTVLAKKARCPRTTLYPILQRLSDRGFVQRIRVANHFEWQAVEAPVLYRILREQMHEFKTALPLFEALRQMASISNKKQDFVFYESREGVRRAYESMLQLKPYERVFTIEGNGSVLRKMKSFRGSYITDWQAALKRKKIILESLIGEKSVHALQNTEESVRKAHKGRTVITTVLPDEWMDFSIDLLMFRKTVTLISIEENLALSINNPRISEFFHKIFLLMQGLGKRVDLNAMLK